ncbi:flocculation protein FLO11-like [Contarinia nasturtii]|uniref:flocculation protein FLO11-like n=1 Tax=Contarinia nasturtii TaxID=265458 RepID=UPI0012D3D2BD|nr:flocculation protein FLO11-like [Contarinia nasturtii]
MKSEALLVIFSLFIMGIYAATTGAELPIASETTDIPVVVDNNPATPAETTEAAKPKPTKSTPTQDPTTTEAPPTTTTTAVPTSSSTTSSTTAAPTSTSTTAASTTTSTTAAPTTTSTTAAPKTTTVAPKPVEPKSAKYYVEENNVTCILVEFAAQLNISYGKDQYVLYNLPSNDKFVQTDGKCGNETTEQNLVVIWTVNHEMNTLNLTFNLNTTSKPKEYSLTKAVFNLSSSIIPDNTERLVLYHVGDFFETRQTRSYHCGRAQKLNLTKNADPKSEVVGNVTLSHVFMEAYRSANDQKFSESLDCDAINTPDIVPIAVGIALIALVVVVLIAYLVGRRRAQSRGYVSM